MALLGTAAFLSILIGVPVGIWCGYSRRAATAIRPVLDVMQTMPAFVYLVPVIALFGIGKPSGIIATVIFCTPPMVRLTALGIRGVPAAFREAALAFGATRRFLLFKIDLPLALPSIRIGVSQTILKCLSMVVIASLIGAKGLGEDVLSRCNMPPTAKASWPASRSSPAPSHSTASCRENAYPTAEATRVEATTSADGAPPSPIATACSPHSPVGS